MKGFKTAFLQLNSLKEDCVSKIRPRKPSGFPELLPAEQIEFNRMLNTIRKTYELFGFAPIETPAIELSDVLLTKTGGDTEQEIYRFNKGSTDLTLHFDLTVPLARYVAEHEHELTFPFRRHQMQKVWRGEGPQRGRFREFYQCDIDVIGTTSLTVDAEIPSVINTVFQKLGIGEFTIRINNRKILNGLMQHIGAKPETITSILKLVDKIDKRGKDFVMQAIAELGVTGKDADLLLQTISIHGKEEAFEALTTLPVVNELFSTGIDELKTVCAGMRTFGVPDKNFTVDISIARGLDYYTGTVYETLLNEHPEIGSICSGGRFDNLAEYYTNTKLPGVGISIGLTRLFSELQRAKLINIRQSTPTNVLVVRATPNATDYCLQTANRLRTEGIPTEVYLEGGKLKKQYGYADKLQIPFVIAIGDSEMDSDTVSLTEMISGARLSISLEEAIEKIKLATTTDE